MMNYEWWIKDETQRVSIFKFFKLPIGVYTIIHNSSLIIHNLKKSYLAFLKGFVFSMPMIISAKSIINNKLIDFLLYIKVVTVL